MSETRGPLFSDVERAALAAADAAGVTLPSDISRSRAPEEIGLLIEVLEARISDVECRLEARLLALESR